MCNRGPFSFLGNVFCFLILSGKSRKMMLTGLCFLNKKNIILDNLLFGSYLMINILSGVFLIITRLICFPKWK